MNDDERSLERREIAIERLLERIELSIQDDESIVLGGDY